MDTLESYQIKLPLFEGPMDLLLHLIRENKLDIYDIPIALITHQYLEYIELMKELNLEVAGDFLVMAATLIHIKSRMLLPIDEITDANEEDDPRLELVMRLLEYKAFKEAALTLQERQEEWDEVFTRDPISDDEDKEAEDTDLSLFDLNLLDLITAFNTMLAKAPPEVRTLTRDTLTIKDRIAHLIDSLQDKDIIRFESLFTADSTISHLVVTFVALLETIRLGIARVYQEREFGSIWIINAEANLTENEMARIARDAALRDAVEKRVPTEHSRVIITRYKPLPMKLHRTFRPVRSIPYLDARYDKWIFTKDYR